jgi:hypothetical protein
MLNVNTVLNAAVSVAILGYALFLIFRGRREIRTMMVIYAVAGFWSTLVHGAVFYDYLITDFMAWQFVTTYLIKPLLFILLCTVLAAVIKSGWRYDD